MNKNKRFANKIDIATGYAKLKKLTVKESKERLEDFLEVLVDLLADPEYDGVIFRNLFSIEKSLSKAREGTVPASGKFYQKPPTLKLKIFTGKTLNERMNVNGDN